MLEMLKNQQLNEAQAQDELRSSLTKQQQLKEEAEINVF